LQQTFYSTKSTKDSHSKKDKKRPNEQLWKLLDEIKMKKVVDRENAEEEANLEINKAFVENVEKQLEECV